MSKSKRNIADLMQLLSGEVARGLRVFISKVHQNPSNSRQGADD
jgi:hypothetical protein